MSFGGAVSAMVTSLKNNKRPRKSALKRYEKYTFKDSDRPLFDQKATPEQLAEIRERIQKENKRTTKIYMALFIIIVVLGLFVFHFLKL